MRVAILDYGAGNLHSLVKAAGRAANVEVMVTQNASMAAAADVLVLPGVGAFGSASASIAPNREIIRTALARGLPCLGICLGMQMLFDASAEGEGEGLGAIPGRVRRLDACRVPQMGWNTLEDMNDPLFEASGLDTPYFANSYVCEPSDGSCITSWATHESDRFAASVRVGNIVGVQFHPEKSSSEGCNFIGEFFARARQ